MSRKITQPVNQVRLTNVAIVRMNRHGKRFEVACYRNKILNYRQGIETDLSEVLQTDRVFTNVSKGLFASSKDLQSAFDTTDEEKVCRLILAKGTVQVSDMERNATLENTAREVANMVATKCVNPLSERPYTTNQIRDAMKKAEFSVQPTSTRSVKQQFLDCVKAIKDKGILEIQRAKMELAIVVKNPKGVDDLVKLLQADAQAIIQPSEHRERVIFFVDPSMYRTADGIAKKIGATLEIVRNIVTREGDVDVTVELEHYTSQQRQNEKATNEVINSVDQDETFDAEVHDLDHELESMNLNIQNPFATEESDHDDMQHLSQRKKNKQAQKKSKKAKRREKEELALREERINTEKARREEREMRIGHREEEHDLDKEKIAAGIVEDGSERKSCNTCGGSFTPAEYRAHFRSDWHRYNQKLKLKGLNPVDEKEFLMFDADAFFT